MTTILYEHSSSRFAAEFRGHAGFAPAGSDIVCAAVSVLASEMVFACRNAQQNGEIQQLECVQKNGYVRVCFTYAQEGSLRDILSLILQCLAQLAVDYAPYVSLKKLPGTSKRTSTKTLVQ